MFFSCLSLESANFSSVLGFFSGESYLKTKIEALGVFIAPDASLLPGLPSGQHTELGSVCACNFFIPEFVSQLLIPVKHHMIFLFSFAFFYSVSMLFFFHSENLGSQQQQYIYSFVQSYDTCSIVSELLNP